MPDASKQLDSQLLSQWHGDYSGRLRAFLVGLLRNQSLADEALQLTFAKALTDGGNVQPGSERAWLFQVAFNEAMMIRRRAGIDRRAIENMINTGIAHQDCSRVRQPDEQMVRQETIEVVRKSLDQLPGNQRQVVELRIYQQMSFQEIADELKIPLGTALTRMRTALGHLKIVLSEVDSRDSSKSNK